jgi:hypothetical protein
MVTRAVRKVLMIENHARTLVAVCFFLIKLISVIFLIYWVGTFGGGRGDCLVWLCILMLVF